MWQDLDSLGSRAAKCAYGDTGSWACIWETQGSWVCKWETRGNWACIWETRAAECVYGDTGSWVCIWGHGQLSVGDTGSWACSRKYLMWPIQSNKESKAQQGCYAVTLKLNLPEKCLWATRREVSFEERKTWVQLLLLPHGWCTL